MSIEHFPTFFKIDFIFESSVPIRVFWYFTRLYLKKKSIWRQNIREICVTENKNKNSFEIPWPRAIKALRIRNLWSLYSKIEKNAAPSITMYSWPRTQWCCRQGGRSSSCSTKPTRQTSFQGRRQKKIPIRITYTYILFHSGKFKLSN